MTFMTTAHEEESLLDMLLEQQLTGPWAAELCKAWRETAARFGNEPLSLNLHDLTYLTEKASWC